MPNPSRYGTEPLLAVAHRGGSAHAPENTWAAFEHAQMLGYSYLETDVRATSDGIAVAMHDAHLGRMTGSPGRVHAHTWDELTHLRVAQTETIPRIEDLLGAWPHARWMLDVKQLSAIGPLIDAVRRTGSAPRVCLAGTWDRWLVPAGRELPAASTALGWSSVGALLSGRLTNPGAARFVHLPLRVAGRWLATEHLIERTHRLGLRLVVWGSKDPATMSRLIDAGIDGLITDHTGALRQEMLARHQWPAPEAGRTGCRAHTGSTH